MGALQRLCGADQMITSASHRIWMAVLADSGMLEMGFARLASRLVAIKIVHYCDHFTALASWMP